MEIDTKKAATTDDSSAGFILTCCRKVLFVQLRKINFGLRQLERDIGGSNEDRTRYLVVANDALSQMSYGPISGKRLI